MHKFTNVHTGSVLLIQRPAEAAAFAARQPRVLPTVPTPPIPSLAYRLSINTLRIVAILLLVFVLALWFFLFGEERPERVRPELTPAQRTQAFRMPHS